MGTKGEEIRPRLPGDTLITKEQIYDSICKIISDYAYAYSIDPSGTARIEWASESVFRATGYSMEDLQRDPYLLAGFGRKADWDQATLRLLSGEVIDREAKAQKKNGEIVEVWYHAEPIWDQKHERVIAVVGAARDITNEKQYQVARQLSENELREIANKATAAISAKDLMGRYTFVNSKFQALAGLSGDEIIGRTDSEIFDPEEAARYGANDREAIDKGVPIDTEVVATVNDAPHYFLSTKFPLRDPSGQIYAVCSISTDVTSLKKAEEELRRRDHDIRQAYADVIAAVTGNRFILMNVDEVEESLGEPVSERFEVNSFSRLAEGRAFVREAIETIAPGYDRTESFIMAVGEALTNAVKHGGGGSCRIFREDDVLKVMISDRGPGIDFRNLPKATLLSGFSTSGTLGIGFTIQLDASDRVLLATHPGSTVVVLELGIGPGGGARHSRFEKVVPH